MKKIKPMSILILLIHTINTQASELTIPFVFESNTPALAFEVNANFNAVELSIDDNDSRMDNLEALILQLQADLSTANSTITQLTSRISSIENNSVLQLDGLLGYNEINGYATAEFSAVNVTIISGSGSTDTEVNGLGNLTIGYNELNGVDNVRTGSHNLILGFNNSYSSFGSFINGENNYASQPHASIISGRNHLAASKESVIIGGTNNTTSAIYSVVVAGAGNKSQGVYSAIFGGFDNKTIGVYSTISGGSKGKANELYSSINGGLNNKTTGVSSVVNGGQNNLADGENATVCGGFNNFASGKNASVSGGNNNTALGEFSSVSGGSNRFVLGQYDWTAGALFEDF